MLHFNIKQCETKSRDLFSCLIWLIRLTHNCNVKLALGFVVAVKMHAVFVIVVKQARGFVVAVKVHMLVLMSKSTCWCWCQRPHVGIDVKVHVLLLLLLFIFCDDCDGSSLCPHLQFRVLSQNQPPGLSSGHSLTPKKSFICGIQADTGWQSSKVRKKIALFGERHRQNRLEMKIQLSSNIQKYGENGIFSLILQVFLLLRLLTTLYYKIDNLVGLNLKDLKI